MMKCSIRFWVVVFILMMTSVRADEIVIISGGPALKKWERLRVVPDRHDRWWGNFVRPARVQMQKLRKIHGKDAKITWLVHRTSYQTRGSEEGRPFPSFVESVKRKVNCKLVWFDSGSDVIRYINRGRGRNNKIKHLEFFGHSNKHCWMFDYSNVALGVSTSFLHVNHLDKIKGRAFTRNAFVKSWGCHTGEEMSRQWKRSVGVPMIGAVGKTDYSKGYYVTLSPGGFWAQ